MSEDSFDGEFEEELGFDTDDLIPDPDDRIWRHPSETGKLKFKSPSTLWYKKDFSVTLPVIAIVAIFFGTVVVYLLSSDFSSSAVNSVRGTAVSDSLIYKSSIPKNSQIQYENVGPTLQQMVENISTSIVSVAIVTGGKTQYVTGAAVSADGDILLSDTSVTPNSKITVQTDQGKTFDAKLVGSDIESGLALVSIKNTNLTPINLASISEFSAGTMAVNISREHINNKLDVSVSKILKVNAKKQLNPSETTIGLLIADPPVPDGNDGGVLVDSSGNLLGIENNLSSNVASTKTYSSTEVAKWVIEDLKSEGDVDHGWLGVEGNTLSNFGVQIVSIQPDSPSLSSGLKVGDVIVGINGLKIASLGQLQMAMFSTQPGQTVILQVERNSQLLQISVTLSSNQ